MPTVLAGVLAGVMLATSLGASAPADLSRYRGIALGDPIATVVARLQLQKPEIRVLAEQPSLVQEMTWRPNRFLSGQTVVPDSLSDMVLTFHTDKLVRIVATYHRERIEGLTDADLVELLSNESGLPLLLAAPSKMQQPPYARRTLGAWADVDTHVQLWRDDYPRRVGLTVASTTGAAALETALAQGARRAADAETQRRRDELAETTRAIKERDERVRLQNKAGFKP